MRKSKRSNPLVHPWTRWGFGSWVNFGTWMSVHICDWSCGKDKNHWGILLAFTAHCHVELRPDGRLVLRMSVVQCCDAETLAWLCDVPVPLALHVPTVFSGPSCCWLDARSRVLRACRRGLRAKGARLCARCQRAGLPPRVAVPLTAPGLIFAKVFVLVHLMKETVFQVEK